VYFGGTEGIRKKSVQLHFIGDSIPLYTFPNRYQEYKYIHTKNINRCFTDSISYDKYTEKDLKDSTYIPAVWYRVRHNSEIKGWVSAEYAIIAQEQTNITHFGSNEYFLYMNHRDCRENGFTDLYLVKNDFTKIHLLAKNVFYVVYTYKNKLLTIQYEENLYPSWPLPHTGDVYVLRVDLHRSKFSFVKIKGKKWENKHPILEY
jgi:hypothetical protein